MDYRVYHLSRKEVCKSITLAGLLTVAIAYLFYASWLGIAFFPVFIWFFMKRQKKAGEEQMQLQLAKEFVDTLRSISAALLAGFSIENAWKEAEKEILALYGKRSYMYQEVKEMNCSISLNQPLELLLGDFSTRSGNMDNVLYGNGAGALFMTACLAAYGGAIVLAEKIMTIHM